FAAILRHDIEREDDVVLVADRRAALVSETLRRRPTHRHRLDVARLRKIEAWRNAGVARIAPVGLPARRNTHLDAGAQSRAALDTRARDQAHGGALRAIPRRGIRRLRGR